MFECLICMFQHKGNAAEGQEMKLSDHSVQELRAWQEIEDITLLKTCSETPGKKHNYN